MNERQPNTKLNAQVLEEASTWFVEFSEGEVRASARKAFNQWLRTSPEHVRAYLQITALWEDAALLDRSRVLDADELIALARSDSNVVALEVTRRRDDATATLGRRPVSSLRVGQALVAASILIGAVGLVIWQQFVRGTYATSVGEQRSIMLVDGSTIDMNAHSKVRVRFTTTERTLELLDGQALFRVAKDATRPFVVRSDGLRVRAIGTQFDVNRIRTGTIVTVLEGSVAVVPSSSGSFSEANGKADGNLSGGSQGNRADVPTKAPRSRTERAGPSNDFLPVYLAAGDQVTVTGQALPHRTRTDPAAVTAWRQRKLEFASSPLTEVADEYNRYHDRRLVVRDATLEGFHISGVFSATDSAALLAFLRVQPNLSVRETDSEIEITGK